MFIILHVYKLKIYVFFSLDHSVLLLLWQVQVIMIANTVSIK